MTYHLILQEIVSKIKHNSDTKVLINFINEKINLLTPEERLSFLNEKTNQGLNILALSANQSPGCLQVILDSLLHGLEEKDICAVLSIKDNHGYTLLEQVARTSPNHIKAVLNSNAFLKLGAEYRLKSLIEKNGYGISFIEYALKHESSAFIKAVFSSTAIQNMLSSDLFKVLTLKDSNDTELFMSATNSSIEHLKTIINKEILQKLPGEALNSLLLRDHIDGNSLLSFTALTQPLTKLNILLDIYNDFHLPGESILNLFTHKNDDGKKLIEVAVSKGPDYISSIFNHDIIFKQLNSTQQLNILTTYNQSGEPVLISAFNQSPEHVKAVIKSNTFLNLSPQEVIQVFGVKDQSGDTFLDVLHAKGSEDYVKILQDSEVFHSLNHELQNQILEQVGIHYDELT
ncbi:conserved hypothetical protein [Alphaproteobacteria bacterium]